MFRIAVRNLLTHKARLLMTMLAVVLGVAFVTGTLVFSDTVSQGFQNASAADLANVDVAVRPTERAQNSRQSPELTDSLLSRVRELPGVASARGEVSGAVYVIDKSNNVIGNRNIGVNITAGGDPNHTVVSGRAPSNSGEVALDAATADKAGVKVGDTVPVTVDGPVHSERVVGIVSTTDPAVSAGAALAVFDTATAQQLFGTPGQFDEIVVAAAPGTSADQLVSAIKPLLAPTAQAVTAATVIADERAANVADATLLGQIFLGFALVALFVAIFLIANTFTMLVAQRTRELALLRALGASRREVTRSVQVEAFLVGIVSSAIGLGIGILVGIGIRGAIDAFTGAHLPGGAPVIALTTVLIPLLAGTAVTMLAAWLPGRRAAKIPPVAAMSSVDATPAPASLRIRNIIGFVLGTISIVVVALGMASGDSNGAFVIGAGGGGLVIALVILTPFLSRPLLGLLDRPMTRWFGVAGKLATGNARRNPRRTASTTAALMLGLVLITTLTVISASVGSALAERVTGDLSAQFAVSTVNNGPLDPSVGATIAKVPGVALAVPLRRSVAEIAGGDADGEEVTGVDPATFGSVVTLNVTSGTVAALGGGVLISDTVATKHHWVVGDQAPITFVDGKRQDLRIGAIFKTEPLLSDYVMPIATLDQHAPPRDGAVLVKTDADQTGAVPGRIKAALASNPLITVQTHDDLRRQISGVFDLVLNLVYGLLGMALIISVLGVVNTMAMSVFERTREIGLLRAIGLRRNGIRRMIQLESIVISLFGAVLGIGIGVFLAWALGSLFSKSALLRDTYQLLIPWERVGLFIVVAALVGVIAAVWPARRAAKLNILAAVKTD